MEIDPNDFVAEVYDRMPVLLSERRTLSRGLKWTPVSNWWSPHRTTCSRNGRYRSG